MESKYYAPSDDEFRIGFEFYSVEEIDGSINGPCTIKDCYDLEVQARNCWKNYSDILIKYLDKEDIESFGFRFWKIHPGTTTHEFETNDGRYNITFDPNWSDGWNCTIQDEVDFTFFHGFIKNKSELKVILKQVGIINE